MCWGTSARVSSVARPQVLVLGWYFPWHGAAAAAAEQIWGSATGICFPAFVLLAAFCAHCILSESTERIWLPKCLAGKIGHKNQPGAPPHRWGEFSRAQSALVAAVTEQFPEENPEEAAPGQAVPAGAALTCRSASRERLPAEIYGDCERHSGHTGRWPCLEDAFC